MNNYRSLNNLLLFIFVYMLSSCQSLFTNKPNKPVIKVINDQYTIVLPNKIKKAIKNYNQQFTLWETKDYAPSIRKLILKENNDKIAPFGIIIDINNDGILDVILDGHDKKNVLLIAVISQLNDYNVINIRNYGIVDPSTIINYNEGREENGLHYFFTVANERNDDFIFSSMFPQRTNAKGELLNDGGWIEFYFRNGRFEEIIPEF